MRYLFLLFITISLTSYSQDLTGFWKGKLTQDTGGYAPEYVLEMNINQKKKNISGESKAYLGKIVVAKLTFTGYFYKDSIYFNEFKNGILEQIVPPSYLLCIKNYILSYKKQGNYETLTGRWDGIAYAKKDEDILDAKKNKVEELPCIPGLIYLSKNDELPVPLVKPTQNFIFPDSLNQTKIVKIDEIEVENPIIEISINDYEKVDGDRVSLYLNRKLIAENISIHKQPSNFTLTLNAGYITNEILIFAENLGKIPPNTSLLVVKDGDQKHQVYVSSDLKTTAAIYIKYKPKQ